MRVKQIKLRNFRNYPDSVVDLAAGKTILIGANAQGKSNFLEAIEIASCGRSSRAEHDRDLIAWGQQEMSIEVLFERGGFEQTIAFRLAQRPGARKNAVSVERSIKINGLQQSSSKALGGRLVTVSFKSDDLNLLRGGPKHRREWIDGVALRLRPAFHDTLASYQKVISQRNRLLKELFEKHRVTVSDQDQLLAWDKQVARYGAQIIKQRLGLLAELLPLAERHQEHISGHQEKLAADYLFQVPEARTDPEDESWLDNGAPLAERLCVEELSRAEAAEVAAHLLKLLKERRGEEIARKQTTIGPHRDDVTFTLNNASATSFASQGQQRSLVLSLKLAELELIGRNLDELPVLLLDDVLAELDLDRQSLLMSAVADSMQTVITTTHVSAFDPRWLEGACILKVAAGRVAAFERLPT
ncbi:MAG TPA: DNA replication and repair protein RecF [Candidatus Obscuribacterales bacterium]